MAWDYIVVGAGSAGCAVAGRLSEDGRSRVLVLEAGGSDRRLAIAMPAASFLLALGNPRYDWAYKAEPDPTRNGRRDLMPRGKVLGGTSAINGMSYVRGQPADYDGWAALGCRGWDFGSVLPYFKRAEDNENGADAYHGTGGPLAVSNSRTRHPLSEAYLQILHRQRHEPRGRYQRAASSGRRLRARHPAPGAAVERSPRLSPAGDGAEERAGADTCPRAACAVRGQTCHKRRVRPPGPYRAGEGGWRRDSLRRRLRVAAAPHALGRRARPPM